MYNILMSVLRLTIKPDQNPLKCVELDQEFKLWKLTIEDSVHSDDSLKKKKQ